METATLGVMSREFTDAVLLGYLDEALPVERMTAVEGELRASAALRERLSVLCSQRDEQGHSVGDVWRRGRLSCPGRKQLGSFLLGALDPAFRDYIEFHLQTVGCRYCAANLQDLQTESEGRGEAQQRRRKFFESSAGYMRRREADS